MDAPARNSDSANIPAFRFALLLVKGVPLALDFPPSLSLDITLPLDFGSALTLGWISTLLCSVMLTGVPCDSSWV